MQKLNIEIADSINKNQRIRAIEIFYDAFEQKIRALIKPKEKAIAIYSKSLKNDQVFYAYVLFFYPLSQVIEYQLIKSL